MKRAPKFDKSDMRSLTIFISPRLHALVRSKMALEGVIWNNLMDTLLSGWVNEGATSTPAAPTAKVPAVPAPPESEPEPERVRTAEEILDEVRGAFGEQ